MFMAAWKGEGDVCMVALVYELTVRCIHTNPRWWWGGG